MVSWWHARRLHSSAMPLTLRPAALGQLCSDGNSCRGSGGPAGALRKRSLHWNFSWRAASPWAITVQHRLCTWQPWTPRRLLPAQATFTSTWFCRITISFCFLPLSCRIPPVCSSIYFFIFFLLVSSSVWFFCFPARGSGELRVWLKCVDWCCCGETPLSSATTSH